VRVAWIHPSWRDLVIDELATDAEGRLRFLAAAGLDGVLLALSTAGGPSGERVLPLLVADADWDVLADRVHALAAEVGPGAHARLLDALRAAILATDRRDPARHVEVAAIGEQALARATTLWDRPPPRELDVDLLRSWYALARRVSAPPPPPALDRTWAALLPAGVQFEPPSELYRLDAWLALCEVLADYDRAALNRLGFFDRHAELVADIAAALTLDMAIEDADSHVVVAAIGRLSRLVPEAVLATSPALEPPWDRLDPPPDPWPLAPLDPLLDVDRILSDLG
jgi:hypothetical protein